MAREDIVFGNLQLFNLEKFIRWESPPTGWVILNTNGASKGNRGPASGGGLLRDYKGKMMKGFMEKFGIYTSPKAELMALRRGLPIAKELNIKQLILLVDSQLVVQ